MAKFFYDLSAIEKQLYTFSEKTGLITGMLKALPDETQMDAIVAVMVAEAIKTSEIEGEFLSRRDVMSSIKNDLGLNPEKEKIVDRRSKGIGQLMVSVRETYHEELTATQLFLWHTMLLGHDRNINAGVWRTHTEPMQIVLGSMGKLKVHYEAPPSGKMTNEMDAFIKWFNNTAPGGRDEITSAPVRCAIAHLYFESIHPFEDGNGRIGRAIAEKALSQGIARPALLSLSRVIDFKKNDYYGALQAAQRQLNITDWIIYFVGVVLAAQQHAEDQIDFVLQKTKFFDKYKDQLTDRQVKVIKRVLEEGPKGFNGGLNATKYGSIANVAKATATRDLQLLLEKGILIPLGDGGGRSTRYQLNLTPTLWKT